jgi:hypothetical protein
VPLEKTWRGRASQYYCRLARTGASYGIINYRMKI